jgi:hypothetical protein
MQYSSSAYLDKQVDSNNYNERDLITIKSKLNLPYFTSSGEYERAYGSIQINGVSYQYVKRRVHNDTLELLCLPNNTSTKLQSAGNDIAKSFCDDQASTHPRNSMIKITLPKFCQSFTMFSFPAIEQERQTVFHNIAFSSQKHGLKHKKPPKPGVLLFC